MKKITFVIIGAILMLSGVTVAQQHAEGKKDSSMQRMMEEMMKEKQSNGGSTQGMGGMGGMMRMMKMMEQCSAMMVSSHHEGKAPKEGEK